MVPLRLGSSTSMHMASPAEWLSTCLSVVKFSTSAPTVASTEINRKVLDHT